MAIGCHTVREVGLGILTDGSHENRSGDLIGCVVVQGGRHMAIDAERDCDSGMAESLLHDPRMDALLEGECRPGVAEAVEREAGEALAFDSAEELSADGVGAVA